MIYAHKSSGALLSKLYRDFRPSHSDWEADAIEWIGEALDFIGVHYAEEKRSINLTITNYRVPLPTGFSTCRGVWYNDVELPYGGDFNKYGNFFDGDVYISSKKTVLETTNSGMTRYASPLAKDSVRDDYFLFNPGYIQTSFATGTIRFAYNRKPVDDDGYPMIPDNVYCVQALWWYVVKQLLLQGYKHPVISYKEAEAKWEEYCVSAGNDMMMPTPAKMEKIKDNWVSFVPEPNKKHDIHNDLDLDHNPATE